MSGVESVAKIGDASAVRQSRSNGGHIERGLSFVSPIALLAVWEISATFGWIDERFFPAPSEVFKAAWAMLVSGELWTNLSVSLVRIGIGFVLGAAPGIVIGLAMGLFSPVRAILQPLVDATFPIPKIAMLPIFMMIFGLGEESKYAIIGVAVFYLVLINTVAGVRNIERIYIDVGKNYNASRWMMFFDVAFPGAMPMIMTGLKLGMGIALLVIVAAEFVGAKAGIGFLIWNSWQTFSVEKMYVGLLVTALLGFAISAGLSALESVLVPWKRR